jgi:DNA-binding MarR family transcriptional regulator
MEDSLPSMEGTETSVDWVGAVVDRWRAIRPDLDPSPMLIIGRIARLEALIGARLRRPFAAAGLADGDFDLLAALRRQGSPHEASPGELASAMLVTSGGTTKRIDRLERQGYVRRRPSPDDGRGRIVALTAAGVRLVDHLLPTHLANEAAIVAELTPTQRDRLARLLGDLATSLEHRPHQPSTLNRQPSTNEHIRERTEAATS